MWKNWSFSDDLDLVIVESQKQEAYFTYLGDKEYQPVTAYWVEQDLIVADEFWDGNVPARMDLLQWAKNSSLLFLLWSTKDSPKFCGFCP